MLSPKQPLIAQMDATKQYLLEQSLPDGCRELMLSSKVAAHYQISDRLNPFYLEADFNGDQKTDAAVLIQDKILRKIGIMVIHGGSNNYFVAGAGRELGNGGDDWSWIDIWRVYRARPDDKISKKVKFSGNGIWVEKSESASAIIYWDGKQYRWQQAGD